jgi:hypothetical protein
VFCRNAGKTFSQTDMPRNELLLTEYEDGEGEARSMTAEEENELLRPDPDEENGTVGTEEIVEPQLMLLNNPFLGTPASAACDDYFEALAEIRK